MKDRSERETARAVSRSLLSQDFLYPGDDDLLLARAQRLRVDEDPVAPRRRQRDRRVAGQQAVQDVVARQAQRASSKSSSARGMGWPASLGKLRRACTPGTPANAAMTAAHLVLVGLHQAA